MNSANPPALVSSRLWFRWLLPALLPMLGCGTAEYEADVNTAVARAQLLNKFRNLDTVPTVLAAWRPDPAVPLGTKITFRKPAAMGNKPMNDETPDPLRPGETIRPERLRPAFLSNFPGYRQTWEAAAPGFSRLAINYLYVGAQAAEPGAADRLLEEVKTAFPDLTNLAWSNVSVLTPEGNNVTWRLLSFDAEQEFWPPGATEATKAEASFQLWMREEQGQQVFVAGRWADPKGNVQPQKQDLLASLGTVTIATRVKID